MKESQYDLSEDFISQEKREYKENILFQEQFE